VVQEAFIRAWRGATGFRADGGFWGWLRRITANAAIERLRARKAARSAELEEETLAEEAHGAEAARLGEEDPVERTSASELAAALRKELARLDPEHRTAISLHAEGLSYKEIAEQMNCPIGTVMSRLFYARRTLAGRLRRHMEP
jgi:RNA polymerase sigma-70 factor (ECF subfamily)